MLIPFSQCDGTQLLYLKDYADHAAGGNHVRRDDDDRDANRTPEEDEDDDDDDDDDDAADDANEDTQIEAVAHHRNGASAAGSSVIAAAARWTADTSGQLTFAHFTTTKIPLLFNHWYFVHIVIFSFLIEIWCYAFFYPIKFI